MPQHHIVVSGRESLHLNGDIVLWRPYTNRIPSQRKVTALLRKLRSITGLATKLSDIVVDFANQNLLLVLEHTGPLTAEQVAALWPGKDTWYNAIRHGDMPCAGYPVWVRSYQS
jgi:hypothetical protein